MENILFLHGWGGDENSFAPILPYFRTKYNCICVSMPREPHPKGTRSDTPSAAPSGCHPSILEGSPCVVGRAWTLDDYADLVFAELDKQNITHTHIIAHSFGARVTALLATKQPKRFGKLILTGPAGIKPRPKFWRTVRIRLHKMKIIKSKGSADYRNLSLSGKITFQNIIKRDLSPEIAKLTQPCLIIWGARDSAIKKHQINKWTKLNAHTTLKIYKSSGHFCFLDEPVRFIVDVEEFLNV